MFILNKKVYLNIYIQILIIEDLFCRHTCVWLEHLSKLRIRKLHWVLDPDIRLQGTKQKDRAKPQPPELSQVAWYSTWDTSDTSIRRKQRGTKQARHRQLPAWKWGMWQTPSKFLSLVPCQGGHLHCRVSTDHKFSSVTMIEVSQGSWSHGPFLSLASTSVSHKGGKEVSHRQQWFYIPVRFPRPR